MVGGEQAALPPLCIAGGGSWIPEFWVTSPALGTVAFMGVRVAMYERARRDIVRVVHRGLDRDDFSRAVTRIVRRVIPFEGMCLLTIDPSTMLPTGEIVENGLPAAAMPRLTEIELRERDFNKFTALARGRQPAASSARPPRATWSAACASVSYAGPAASGTSCESCAAAARGPGGR
jgi:hypothetical protein